MSNKKFTSARDAAAVIAPRGRLWNLYYDDLCDREHLMKYAEILDAENPLTEKGCYYIAGSDGSLGVTVDKGRHINWLASLVEPALPEESLPIAETPWMVIKDTLAGKAKGFVNCFRVKGLLKRALILGAVLLIICVGAMVWQRYCAKNGSEVPLVVRILSYLTFADGGVSPNILYMIGSFIGKTFVMSTLFAVILGGFKRVWRGTGRFVVRTFRLNSKRRIRLYLTGMGIACVLYNFFTGVALLRLSMIGVAGFLSMTWALGGGVHFIRRMTIALTAYVNRETKVHYADIERAYYVLSGMALGFLGAIAMSLIPWPFTPYAAGGGFLLIALVLPLFKRRAPKAVACALLAVPAVMHAGDWYLEFDRVETYTKPDIEISTTVNIMPNRHEFTNDEWYGRGVHAYTCTTPPRIIKRGDEIELFTSDIFREGVSFVYPDIFRAGTREMHSSGTIQTSIGYINSKSDDFGLNPDCFANPPISMPLDFRFYKYLVSESEYPNDYGAEAKEGDEFAIVFDSYFGQTLWIYKYHPEPPVQTVVVISGGNGAGGVAVIITPPVAPDGPGDYGGMTDGGMAGVIGGTILVIALGSGLAGGNQPPGGTPPGGRPSDRYVRRDEEGNLIVKNPISGEEETLPPGTDEETMRSHVESVLRNRDYYDKAQSTGDAWRKDQESQWKQHLADRQAQRDKEKLLNTAKKLQQNHIDRLMDKYGVYTDKELRLEIKKEQNAADAEYWKNMSAADYAELGYQIAKTTKDACDVTMDILACTSEQAAHIRDGYKALAEIAGSYETAKVQGRDTGKAVLAGTLRASITYIQYHTTGGAHAGAVVMGEGVRDYISAVEQGKSAAEAGEAALRGIGRGIENQFVDFTTGKLGDYAKGVVENKTIGKLIEVENVKDYINVDKLKQIVNQGNTNIRYVEQLTAATDDVFKIAFDDYISG